ncbi:MAG TPA: hypothetical protein ENJ80_05510 [Gammaproteobacteria bacterium]|nr:hypothetical protein [Gammaproteobacteria bacterium]
MSKPFLTCLRVSSLAASLLAMSSLASAVGVTFLAPGWTTSDFLTLSTPTRAIEFDSAGNLYIEDTTDDNSGQIQILKLDASSGYSASSVFASYNTSYKGATGLDFGDLGGLYVSERSVDGDAGIIRKVDVATRTLLGDVMAFENHRPTGVDADTSGNVYYSGRKESDGTWGRLFEIDSTTTTRSILIDNTVGTGIALDASGNIFITTPQRTDLPLLANSIYMYNPADILTPELIATFGERGGELTFDTAGNLYMVAQDQLSIIRLSSIPIPAAAWLFGSGLLGLIGIAKRKAI